MSSPHTATLLLSCPDRRGLVAVVADWVSRHGGNIVHADQHTDDEEGLFLQRVEFELDGFDVERGAIPEAFAPVAERFAMRWSVRCGDALPRLAILVSRQGHCLLDLLARWRLGELRADTPLVLSNHADHEQVCRELGAPFRHLPRTAENSGEQEAEVAALLETHGAETIVLARYMQILSPAFVARYPGRIINIHHSFLPAFAGGRPYHQAHERGVKIVGATAHYVTDELDQGPIIEQDVVRVSHRDSVDDMVHKGRDLEKVVLARAVHLHLEHRVLVYGNKTVVFD
ncbi:MAG: formyltetrahydrofolate deformylase [Planctomycetota bacterium]|jgi:formyltetrahydrofolate deformylase